MRRLLFLTAATLLASAALAQPFALRSTALMAAEEAPVTGVSLHGDYAYVGGASVGYYVERDLGIRILDVSNPDAPVLVGRIPLQNMVGDAGYATADAQVTTLDTDFHDGPVAIVQWATNAEEPYASMAEPFGIWDVSDPENPEFLSAFSLGEIAHSPGGELGDKPIETRAVSGSYYYSVFESGGFSVSRNDSLGIVDLSDPLNPRKVGAWSETDEVVKLSIDVNDAGDRVYVAGVTPKPFGDAATHFVIYVLDVSDPARPSMLGKTMLEKPAQVCMASSVEATTDDHVVVLADGCWDGEGFGGLHFFNVSDPSNITHLKSIVLPGNRDRWETIATDIAIRDNTLYAAWMAEGVCALDISDPANPVELGRNSSPLEEEPWISDVAVSDAGEIYATSVWTSGLFVYSAASAATDIDDIDLPERFEITGNYPNPFNPSTVITYSVPTAGTVLLTVYDVLGRAVETLVDGPAATGTHQAVFEAGALPSGMYLVEMISGSARDSRTIVLVR